MEKVSKNASKYSLYLVLQYHWSISNGGGSALYVTPGRTYVSSWMYEPPHCTHSAASVRPFVPLCCTVHNTICRAGGTKGINRIFSPDLGRFKSKTCSIKCHVFLLAPLRFRKPSAASERPLYLTTVWVCFCSGWPRSGNEKWKDSQNSFRIIHFTASWSWRRTTFFFL